MSERIDALFQSPAGAWIRAFNAGNVEAIVALYAEDAELFDSGMYRPRRGIREITHWFHVRFGSMPSNIYTPRDEVQVETDCVVVPWVLHGRGPRLLGLSWFARPIRVEGVSYFTLRQGRIYRQQGIYDHLAVLKQLIPLFRWLPSSVPRFLYTLYLRRHGLY
ncbi:MAG TPA: nuclear transport factor 2 family protein [Ktedonobacteraceae bacterium]|jgi:steroid delta-isomerase-like uncharacterized protein